MVADKDAYQGGRTAEWIAMSFATFASLLVLVVTIDRWSWPDAGGGLALLAPFRNLYFGAVAWLVVFPLAAATVGRCSTRWICKKDSFTVYDWGVWIWGALLIAVAALIGWISLAAALAQERSPEGLEFGENTQVWFRSLYQSLVDFGTLVGAMVGFGGLAWTYFFKNIHSDKPKSDSAE
ncbi:MAG: hypothetical protein AAFY08_13540 [Planctomycetota bacterium]